MKKVTITLEENDPTMTNISVQVENIKKIELIALLELTKLQIAEQIMPKP